MNKNRIIKFRVWDIRLETFLSIKESDTFSLQYFLNRKNEYVVSQFTGQLDKSGQEIYEGDKIKFFVPNFEGALTRELEGYIEYNSELAKFLIVVTTCDYKGKSELYGLWEVHEKKIIGNIYENQT